MENRKSNCSFQNRWGTYTATCYPPSHEPGTVHPVVLFVHGFMARKEWYSWIGEYLANHGYAAFLFTVPSPRLPDPHQWSDGFKSAIDCLADEGNQFHHMINFEEIGTMGHSMGGLGALLAGYEDSRIKCVVGLAPAILPEVFQIPERINALSKPVQLQIGSNDGLIPPLNVKAFFDGLSTVHKSYVEIKGGNHIRFMNKGSVSIIGEYLTRFGTLGSHFKDDKAKISFEDQHAKSSTSFLEWYQQHLRARTLKDSA